MALPCLSVHCDSDMVIMGLKRFSNQELTNVIKAAGTLQFDDDMLLDRTSQQLMLSVHKMSADELFNLVYCHPVYLHMCLAVNMLTLPTLVQHDIECLVKLILELPLLCVFPSAFPRSPVIHTPQQSS